MRPETLKFSISLFALAILFFGLLMMRVSGTSSYKKLNILYILLGGLLIGATGFLQLLGLSARSLYFFILLQVLFLGFGILNVYLVFKVMPWAKRTNFWGPFLLTVATGLMGGVFLQLAFELAKMAHFNQLMLSALVWFVVPVLFTGAVEAYFRVPERVFKTWMYPLHQQVPEPTDNEMAYPLVISFEFKKKTDDDSYTIFRAKAPKDLEFGRLFYYFINDYNSRHPEGNIEFLSDKSLPYPWVFHFKRKWYSSARYLDPEDTVYHNHIKENSVIVCHRIITEDQKIQSS